VSQADLIASMRALARPGGAGAQGAPGEMRRPDERCEICNARIPQDHRHLLHLEDRRIVCSCEACWGLHSGDPEYRPAGMRTVWLTDFDCSDELWAGLRIPIGLAFFLRSGAVGGMVAFYPSPAGATESELGLDAWEALVARNPILDDLETDAEALIANRLSTPHEYVIAPVDECYRLVGMIKSRWEGISGGSALETAVPEFFAGLRRAAGSPA